MKIPMVQAGFNYAAALLKLRARYTYDQIAEYCGYESKGSVSDILAGKTPLHPQGEAIFILYVETFGHKPPANVRNSAPPMTT